MVAHQNDRPHVCNLCGARYIRRCDLLNHLKIHAYVPEDEVEDQDVYCNFNNATFGCSNFNNRFSILVPEEESPKLKRKFESISSSSSYSPAKKRAKPTKTNKVKKIKTEPADDLKFDQDDINVLAQATHSHENYSHMQEVERYPITDPKKPFVCQHCGVGFAREKALGSHSRVSQCKSL